MNRTVIDRALSSYVSACAVANDNHAEIADKRRRVLHETLTAAVLSERNACLRLARQGGDATDVVVRIEARSRIEDLLAGMVPS